MATTDRDVHEDAQLSSRLARSQHDRRRRILAAVLELAAEGGYDAVQVREVARRADVAVMTLYNYYESRENLLYDAMVEWRRRVAGESVANVAGATFEDRVLSLLRHTFEVYAEAPKLHETFSRISVRPGEQDSWAYKVQAEAMERILADVDAAFADDFRLILGRFVYATMAMAGQGHIPIDDVWPDIERMVRRVAASR